MLRLFEDYQQKMEKAADEKKIAQRLRCHQSLHRHLTRPLALRDDGQHIMQLDACIAAMKQTGQEMSHKFKETSLGGLAVSVIDC